MKTDYEAKILADSINTVTGDRLTSFEVTFPRFILAEVNTHRMFSRNSASSRAIPVKKRLEAIGSSPFVPLAFTKNQRGMQAKEVLDDKMEGVARIAWLGAAKAACAFAGALEACGVHKQHANRLVEPFAWQTAIISATEWDNFYALRCHPDAQPEFKLVADLMHNAMTHSNPEELQRGDWHLPMLTKDERALFREARARGAEDMRRWVKISAGRCARVSYLTHDGRRDPDADVALCDRLHRSGHMSPLEHPAMAGDPGFCGNYKGFKQYRKFIPGEDVFRPGRDND